MAHASRCRASGSQPINTPLSHAPAALSPWPFSRLCSKRSDSMSALKWADFRVLFRLFSGSDVFGFFSKSVLDSSSGLLVTVLLLRPRRHQPGDQLSHSRAWALSRSCCRSRMTVGPVHPASPARTDSACSSGPGSDSPRTCRNPAASAASPGCSEMVFVRRCFRQQTAGFVVSVAASDCYM